MTRLLALCAVGAFLLTSCDASNETSNAGRAGSPEGISSLRMVLTPGFTAARDTIVVTGLETGTPTLAPITLSAGATYTGQIVLDAAVGAEIEAEAESHLFTYTPSADILTITGTDLESSYTSENLNSGDYPLGARFRIVVSPTATGTATVAVRLAHFEGAPKGGPDDQSGSQDFAFSLPIVIEASTTGS